MILNKEFKEYNINLIFLNSVLSENIELDISNFLYENNLNLTLKSRDLNNLFKHFIIDNIIKQIKPELDNIFIINFNYNLKYLQLSFDEEDCKTIINKILKKSIKIFSFNIFESENTETSDLHFILKLKKCIQNKSITNFKKIRQYTEDNKLTQLSSKLKFNIKTKLLLNK